MHKTVKSVGNKTDLFWQGTLQFKTNDGELMSPVDVHFLS